jgi:HSP20 family protein
MTEEDRSGEKKREMNLDLGFGGLFKGLGDFLEVLSDKMEVFDKLDKSGSAPGGAPRGATGSPRGSVTRTGQFKVKGLGDDAQGVYGFTIRTGAEGIPRVERFGNIRRTEDGPVVADVREPLVDVFDEPDEIVLVAEMPGANEEDVTVEVHGDVLILETTGERKYAREVLLPASVDAEGLEKTYRNGILEIRLKKSKS